MIGLAERSEEILWVRGGGGGTGDGARDQNESFPARRRERSFPPTPFPSSRASNARRSGGSEKTSGGHREPRGSLPHFLATVSKKPPSKANNSRYFLTIARLSKQNLQSLRRAPRLSSHFPDRNFGGQPLEQFFPPARGSPPRRELEKSYEEGLELLDRPPPITPSGGP